MAVEARLCACLPRRACLHFCRSLLFVQAQTTKLPATTEGESSRGGSPRGHKAGLLTVLNVCSVCVSSRNRSDHPKNWRVPLQELAPVCFNPRPRGWRAGGQSEDFDGGFVGDLISLMFSFLPSRFSVASCSRVFVVGLFVTSSHRRELLEEQFWSSRMQTGWEIPWV